MTLCTLNIGKIAQWSERWSAELEVPGSIPGHANYCIAIANIYKQIFTYNRFYILRILYN